MATIDPFYRSIDDLKELVETKFDSVNARLKKIERKLNLADDSQLLGSRGRRLIDALMPVALGALTSGIGVWLIEHLARQHR